MSKLQHVGLALICATLSSGTVVAQDPAALCRAWAKPQRLGSLDPKVLDESSGMAVSRQFADRVYHINDSGSGPAFHVTDLKGKLLQSVGIRGFVPEDTEDLSIGSCGGGATCLFVADIGDNKTEREAVRIVAIEEREHYGAEAEPLKIIELRYPDGPHNAEAFAVTPGGDFVIVTKEQNKDPARSLPARVYRLAAADASSAEGEPRELESLGTLALDVILPGIIGDLTHLVTALDIAPDGSRLLLLTYLKAIEISVDLTSPFKPVAQWVEGADYRLISTALLPQQEAIAYLPDGRDFIYSTEKKKGFGDPKLYLSRCEQ